jgi:molybdopterin converting factor small subunit
MHVSVLLAGVLRPAADGAARLDVDVTEDADLGALLDLLEARYPLLGRRLRDEQRQLRRYVNFYVDGEECRRLDGTETALTDGIEIQVIPSVAGG